MSDNRRHRIIAAFVVIVAEACAVHTAPPGYLASPADFQRVSFGGWVEVSSRSGTGVDRTTGELIAVSSDSLWILDASGRGRVLATRAVVDGQLTAYDAKPAQVGNAAVLGIVSTISNGGFLVLTAPMWMIGGGAAARSQSRVAMEDLPQARWEDLAAFARFPQGMPPGVELEDIRPRM